LSKNKEREQQKRSHSEKSTSHGKNCTTKSDQLKFQSVHQLGKHARTNTKNRAERSKS
jgi:hypothetical protein